MPATSHHGDDRPLSIKELNDQAMEYEWNPSIPFKYWARALETIYHEGEVSYREGNLANAFVFLVRYSRLVLDDLPKHPEAKTPDARVAFKPLRKRLGGVLEILEVMKNHLEKQYNEWVRATQHGKSKEGQRSTSSTQSKHSAQDHARWSHSSPVEVLSLAENQDLAIDLARKEMQRRRRLPGLTAEEVSKRREARLWDGGNLGFRDMDDEELRKQMEATRRQLDSGDHPHHEEERNGGYISPSTAGYRYPSINKSSSVHYESPRPVPIKHEARMHPPHPARPPKELLQRERLVTPPPVPVKEPVYYEAPPPYSPPKESSPAPSDDSGLGAVDQRRLTFAPAGYLESGKQIRAVVLPEGLRGRFMQLAESNTRANRETCGILCGSLVNNVYFITCLLIPKQTGTSDTCETEDEAGISTFCIESKLVMIGWIHTHPSQECFLSSRDLHTHFGYQVLMPESIAIVCAPRYAKDWGMFRLTNPPGLQHIQHCRKGDVFHPHDIDNLYTDANHVTLGDMEFDVVDLRKKS